MTSDLYRRCQQALHVRFHNGRLLYGGQACLYILATLGYHRTARIFGRWPLRCMVTVAYWLVARHRRFFSHFLFSRE